MVARFPGLSRRGPYLLRSADGRRTAGTHGVACRSASAPTLRTPGADGSGTQQSIDRGGLQGIALTEGGLVDLVDKVGFLNTQDDHGPFSGIGCSFVMGV